MIDLDFTFAAELRAWNSTTTWYLITLPSTISGDIKTFTKHLNRPGKGFGSVRVKVMIGETQWLTSVFPDSKSGCYVLPVKAAVRRKEGLIAGKTYDVSISVLT